MFRSLAGSVHVFPKFLFVSSANRYDRSICDSKQTMIGYSIILLALNLKKIDYTSAFVNLLKGEAVRRRCDPRESQTPSSFLFLVK